MASRACPNAVEPRQQPHHQMPADALGRAASDIATGRKFGINATNPGDVQNYIRTECFSVPVLGQLGNLGRNTLRAPGMQDVDASLLKNWVLSHERRIQFRVEAFNLLNRPAFQVPKTKIFDGSDNVIPTASQLAAPTQTPERQIQLALKLNW